MAMERFKGYNAEASAILLDLNQDYFDKIVKELKFTDYEDYTNNVNGELLFTNKALYAVTEQVQLEQCMLKGFIDNFNNNVK